jgi:phage shock protein C
MVDSNSKKTVKKASFKNKATKTDNSNSKNKTNEAKKDTTESVRTHYLKNSRLYRSESNKMLGGVAGGLADYFNIDATLIRLFFVLFSIFGGSGVLAYLILWIIIPSESNLNNGSEETIRQNTDEIKNRAQQFADDISNDSGKNSRRLFGIMALIFGIAFLLNNFGFFQIFNLGKLWPVILIIIGFAILMRNNNGN